MTLITVTNGRGRPKNPYCQYDDFYGNHPNPTYIDFEQSVQYHEAPGIPDGEYDGELQWQYKAKPDNFEEGSVYEWVTDGTKEQIYEEDERSYSDFKEYERCLEWGFFTRQIWVIKSEKI